MQSTAPRTHRDGRHESGQQRFLAFSAIAAFSLAACVSDAQLLQANENAARHFVEHHVRSNTGCDAVSIQMMSKSEEAGQPLGELASVYRLRASGCGQSRLYEVLCEDRTLCSLKSPPHTESTR
jgi:hypothetical protein